MTKIQWADKTWQVVSGCTKVGEGCSFCYSARLCATRLKSNPRTAGLAYRTAADGHTWTGEVRCHEDKLTEPLHWRKPRRIFVADRGDLFHEAVLDEFLDRIFAVMALCPQHTFLVLTKRPARMLEYIASRQRDNVKPWQAVIGTELADLDLRYSVPWPLPNVQAGVSVWDQPSADEFIPSLLETPAAVRFVSIEPMLAPVDLGKIDTGSLWLDALQAYGSWPIPGHPGHIQNEPLEGWKPLDGVILGAESGPHRRPFDEDWARSIRDDCQAAGTPFFYKQIYRDGHKITLPELDGREWNQLPGTSVQKTGDGK